MTMIVRSPAFADGHRIPLRHTGDGEDVSPPLEWRNVPGAARELALVVDDPDAPSAEPWVHWVIFRIPVSATGLPEAIPRYPSLDEPRGAIQGRNSWNGVGYRGPAPPRGHGLHRYRFRLYALGTTLELGPDTDNKALLGATEGHILDQGELVGVYQR